LKHQLLLNEIPLSGVVSLAASNNDKGKQIMLKLNLGSGKLKIKGYENIDKIYGTDAYPLQFDSGGVDEIRASHILEHFGRWEVKKVLRNWVDKLRPGGVLKIAVPGFDKLMESQARGDKLPASLDAYVFGGQTDENDFHKSMFTEPVLKALLEEAGLVDIQVWESQFEDCASLPISLNLRGQKPGGLETKIHAVMTLPRLAFTANMFAAATIFPKLGIAIDTRTGVFWERKLTELIDLHLNDGTEYIITMDYDTMFKEEHVRRLIQLMGENPDVDCIVPVQIMRENETPMFAIVDTEGNGKEVPLTEFDSELVQIATGHFGLTIFRISAFKNLKKPWFLGKPNEDGDWKEGRIDPDIYFWHNFYEAGNKVCLATNIMIGHMQMMATFPGPARKSFKPEHYYMNQLSRGEWPEHCVPNVEMKK
jgi:predicted SAM-dependent methyltransferase